MGHVSSVSVAYEVGAVMGRELTATGFNLNFAPVLDLNINPESPVIGRRAISDDPQVVAVESNYPRASRQCHHRMWETLSGHRVYTKTVIELATSELTLETLRSRELLPYRELIQTHPISTWS